MRRLPLLLLATAACTALVVLLGGDEVPPPDLPPALRDLVPAAVAAGPGPAVAFDPTLYDDGEAEAAPAAAADRAEVAPPAEADAPKPGPVIVVLAGNPPKPVLGATVCWIAREKGRAAHREKRLPWVADIDLPLLHGARLRTNEDGRAPLPPIAEPSVVSVLHEGQFAAAGVNPDHPPEITLRLRTDETLLVEVRDPRGEPVAGVPVALFQGHGYQKARQMWLGPTGPDGVARATHFQHYRRAPDEGRRFAAALRVPLAEPVAAEFAGQPAQGEPVRLVLPATSRVELTLTDRDGRALLSPATVAVGIVRSKEFTTDLPLEQYFDAVRARKPVGDHVVQIQRVGAGLELQPAARFDHDNWFHGDKVVAAAEPDAVRQARLALPPEFTVLAGRLVDRIDEPLALQEPQFALGVPGGAAKAGNLATTETGHFDLCLRLQDRSNAPHALELRLPAADGATLGLRRDLGALAPTERRELGTLRLTGLPVLAFGVVVDDAGQPVPDATIRLQRYALVKDRETWANATLAAAVTAPDGTFELLGNPPPGQLRVHADARGHFAGASPPIVPGGQLRIALDRAGALAGRVLLPGWMPNDAATLHLRPRLDAQKEGATGLQARGGGRFRIGNLRPGVYDAEIRVRNLPDAAVRLDAVVIGPGDNRDPRLQPIDLRQSVFRYRLNAVGPAGRVPLDGPILARLQRPDGSTADLGFRMQKGRAELITTSAMMALTLFGQGYPPTSLLLAPGDHDVYLQPLHPALITIPGARALAGPDRRVRVSMIFQGDTGLPQSLSGTDQRTGKGFAFPRWELSKSGGAWLGDDDTVAVPLSRNGPHEVVLRIYEDERESGRQGSYTVGTADVVLDGLAPSHHRLSLDRQKLADVVARMERMRLQRVQREQQRQLERQRAGR